MNDDLRLERTATDLLDAAAPSRAPAGLLADTLASVGRTRQRARWLAYLKEPPMRTPNGVAVGSPTFRLVSIALLTLALVLGLTAAVVGGASLLLKTAEVPPPFGLAKNGLVAYANDGDIYTVDPATGATAGDRHRARGGRGATVVARRDTSPLPAHRWAICTRSASWTRITQTSSS